MHEVLPCCPLPLHHNLAHSLGIMVLHIVLFLVLWIVFAGFLILLLNPLLKRITKEVLQGAYTAAVRVFVVRWDVRLEFR